MLTFIFGVVCFTLGVGFMPAVDWIRDLLWDKAYTKGKSAGWNEGWNSACDTYKKD